MLARQPHKTFDTQAQGSHPYSVFDPDWTQIALPRLGAPNGPPTSASMVVTMVGRGLAGSDELPALSAVAAFAHVIALFLFGSVLHHLAVRPLPIAIATLGLGLTPAFFDAATIWTPYVMLPAFVLAAVVAAIRCGATGSTVWRAIFAATALLAIAESIYALLFVSPLAYFVARLSARPVGKSIALFGGTIVAGLALQVVGAAIAWREASSAEVVAAWSDAFVAVTSRWGRLVEIYMAPPASAAAGVRRGISQVGLLVATLGVAGAIALLRGRRNEAWPLILSTVFALFVSVALLPPIATVSAAENVWIVLAFLLAAYGFVDVVGHLRAPLVVMVVLGGVLAIHGVATRHINALETPDGHVHDAARLPATANVSLIAGDVESDRHFEYDSETSATATHATRIPQTPNAIRFAHRPGALIVVRSADAPRVSALGWLLAPHDEALHEVVAEMPCVGTNADEWIDVTRLAHAGAVSVQNERASRYELELEASGLVEHDMAVRNVIPGGSLNVQLLTDEQVRVAVERPRRALVVVEFRQIPTAVRARVLARGNAESARVCSVPFGGGGVKLDADDAGAAVPLQSPLIFAEGWHSAEPIGSAGQLRRWSSSRMGTVLIHLAGAATALDVVVEAAPAALPDRSPTLTLEFNGHRLDARALAPASTLYTWTVPAEHVRQGRNVVRFHVRETVSPRSLGISGDERELGIALTGLRLRRVSR